jgi:hypothetical protein
MAAPVSADFETPPRRSAGRIGRGEPAVAEGAIRGARAAIARVNIVFRAEEGPGVVAQHGLSLIGVGGARGVKIVCGVRKAGRVRGRHRARIPEIRRDGLTSAASFPGRWCLVGDSLVRHRRHKNYLSVYQGGRCRSLHDGQSNELRRDAWAPLLARKGGSRTKQNRGQRNKISTGVRLHGIPPSATTPIVAESTMLSPATQPPQASKCVISKSFRSSADADADPAGNDPRRAQCIDPQGPHPCLRTDEAAREALFGPPTRSFAEGTWLESTPGPGGGSSRTPPGLRERPAGALFQSFLGKLAAALDLAGDAFPSRPAEIGFPSFDTLELPPSPVLCHVPLWSFRTPSLNVDDPSNRTRSMSPLAIVVK